MFKLQKGVVIIKPLERVDQVGQLYVDNSRQAPQLMGEVIQVGEADTWGEPIWKPGDKVLIPNVGCHKIDYAGVTYRITHHMRILAGYED